MGNQKVLITGASGFLGSHIVEALNETDYQLLLTKRNQSNLSSCTSFIDKVKWTNTDSSNFEKEIIDFSPDIIIHAAWNGVAAKNRDEWSTQVDNLQYLQRLLNIAAKSGVKKFIGVGSQAEYGHFDGYVDESFPTNPTSAYGAYKVAAQVIIKTFCEEKNMQWYWFRLFSCFGERESENWLIPSVIKNMIETDKMDLTGGEQQYAYSYIKDVARIFLSAIESNAESGIYNIAADELHSIKEILLTIREYLNPQFKLNFGALPYRRKQSMINGSKNTKTNTAFGQVSISDFKEKLIQTIEFYKALYNNDK
ncbi:NAD(P)-dependent oxidoreductase [Bacteroides sp. 519]|uniref:NAD-dependent epimerase/dehydratase family protein n=1 Tax=Bacteroides sp. 519 TaxID=2302937 RepID=UPI0013D745EF|nr:NAD(P)-dependent oxidoreductase [Bacteroides sp. 519]NDV58029.1 NAD(P)-dependent oxidoreductase [Bacteroides sp. 519]